MEKRLPAPEIPLIQAHSLEARLTLIGTRIRKIIEAMPAHKRPERLMTFPTGSCGDCSMILGTYLITQGFENVEYVVGIDGQQSHAWMECEGIIVDITADQFGPNFDPVIVTKDRTWHDQFLGQQREVCDYREYQDPTIYELYDFSESLLKELSRN